MNWRKVLLTVLTIAFLTGSMIIVITGTLNSWFFKPTDSSIEPGISTDKKSQTAKDPVEVVAAKLTVPWEVAFLPNGDLLVTERSGTIKRIGTDNKTYTVGNVEQTSEGGLLGMALHPKFSENNWLYLYFTTKTGDTLSNKIERYKLTDSGLTERTDIVTGIPAASNHDGGRIAFGPDGYLYVTTGDAGNQSNAQDKTSLAGKILRLQDSGTPVADNPFGNAVYSYGHRNPQGLAWDKDGQLWATEHGPSGTESGHDELNLILKGSNYGWPTIRGSQTQEGMEAPEAHSGSEETWAPAGMAYHDGSLFFAGLRGQTLYQAKIGQNNQVTLKAHFKQTYGRLRAVVAHDGYIYFTTSNTDGRGQPKTNDDKILRIKADNF